MAQALENLPAGLVWQGSHLARPPGNTLPTGFPALDAELPGGGWPAGALIELLAEHPGVGELSLLLPLMRSARAERWIACIAPPLLPYAPALAAAGVPLQRLLLVQPATAAETLWATRQATASGACALVLAWPSRPDTAALRRLQLAAEESATPLFLFRERGMARHASPAPLRLALAPTAGGLRIDILKRRGPPATRPVHLNWNGDAAAGAADASTAAPGRNGARHLALVG
ncbi:translesion DNA synthesis-associated protein ImuA [Thauera linaloolentis]|uniref:Translesion DNA synthesis-associated protein ImuA n=1 Tax=Thauera linaloolentis (strain DSM 12138 / JCM 21573 / CCUG 41526 / CIP 105981 / IAM 15112 / NBRC 102519 / 47Lol) TaxID=1123367 RepID=N6XZH8_THAL4|nr:translesion DNA synthesis-associated protein ImuA [Thauera linaloolentis]ENO84670.1 hypothetical protein C666_16915 [Thauera linaloolentis 47Lol = DSM 12138]MCM8566564.1 translesion DNA synthesis-associated protein ImuA [Thauera linaloolentis]